MDVGYTRRADNLQGVIRHHAGALRDKPVRLYTGYRSPFEFQKTPIHIRMFAPLNISRKRSYPDDSILCVPETEVDIVDRIDHEAVDSFAVKSIQVSRPITASMDRDHSS